MSPELAELIDKARRAEMSSQDQEQQRKSFAYGNTKIENDAITWETINVAADELERKR